MPLAFAEEMVPRRPVVRETQNSTTVIAMFVDATETHQYACVPIVPITNRNANRDIKNKEIQMLNPSARTFSKSSVFIANTFLHQLVMVCPVIFQNSLICLRQSTKHLKTQYKSIATSDVAASSSEVSASICSTTWRHQFADVSQQPSSTWVKKRGGKDSSRLFWLLLSNLLLCCDFVHVYAIKLAK